jgi:hypothetical protein
MTAHPSTRQAGEAGSRGDAAGQTGRAARGSFFASKAGKHLQAGHSTLYDNRKESEVKAFTPQSSSAPNSLWLLFFLGRW